MAVAFDTLAFVKKLEGAGFTRAQAEVEAEALRAQVEAQEASSRKTFSEIEMRTHKDMATREDFLTLRSEMQSLRGEIWRLDNQLIANKHEILKWVVRTMIGLSAFICSVIGMGVAFLMK